MDLTKYKSVYQSRLTDLIRDWGKTVRVYFKPTITSVSSDYGDVTNPDMLRKPSWKESSPNTAPDVVENYIDITALVHHNPKEFRDFNINVEQPSDILRLKTHIDKVPDLTRCEYVIPQIENQHLVYAKYKLIREPELKGIVEDFIAVSYWERIN